jgi:hypothetical protein
MLHRSAVGPLAEVVENPTPAAQSSKPLPPVESSATGVARLETMPPRSVLARPPQQARAPRSAGHPS